jgi:hypothetical protein
VEGFIEGGVLVTLVSCRNLVGGLAISCSSGSGAGFCIVAVGIRSIHSLYMYIRFDDLFLSG